MATFGAAAIAALVTTGSSGPGPIVERPDQPGSVMLIQTPCPWVALTFDDGPNPEITPAVLDTLAAHGATATFYVIGRRVPEQPAIVQRAAAEGHSIGNHTWKHDLLVDRDPQDVLDDLERTEAAVRSVGVEPAPEVRAPRGEIDPEISMAIRRSGRLVIAWQMGPDSLMLRWHNPKQVANHLLERTRPGSIYLFHDGGSAGPSSAAMVGPFLEALDRRGLRGVSVERLTTSARTGRCDDPTAVSTPDQIAVAE